MADFDSAEASATFQTWLNEANQTITPSQSSFVFDAFSNCPSPLYLRLAADFALTWHSYTPLAEINLGNTVTLLSVCFVFLFFLTLITRREK
jgi:hypothetical protein